MDSAEEEEDDEPSSSLRALGPGLFVRGDEERALKPCPAGDNPHSDGDPETALSPAVTDDVVYNVFAWLDSRELSMCAAVCTQWRVTSHCDTLWEAVCGRLWGSLGAPGNTFIRKRKFKSKYGSSHRRYFARHKRVRFDGTYVQHCLRFIAAEPAPFDGKRVPKPYTRVEYFRVLRLFEDGSARWLLTKAHPRTAMHLFARRYRPPPPGRPPDDRRLQAGEFTPYKQGVEVAVHTSYGLELRLRLAFAETMRGASDRLTMTAFDAVDRGSGRDVRLEVAPQPFLFVADRLLKRDLMQLIPDSDRS